MNNLKTILTEKLTSRQSGVLFLICKGLRNAEIARQFNLSERTVKGYVNQLFLIFDVTNRTELAGLLAVELEEVMDAAPPGALEGRAVGAGRRWEAV